MRFKTLLYEAWLSVKFNRSRTALTLLGIVIGVGSVITIVGAGDGAKVVVRDILGDFGSTSLFVAPNFPVIRRSRGQFDMEEITRQDVEQINRQADAVRAVSPQLSQETTVRYLDREETATLFGTMHHFLEAEDVAIEEGRFLTEQDDLFLRKVGVLGYEIAKKLFPETSPLGQFIKIEAGVELEIVGVLGREEKSFISTVSAFDTSTNNRVFIPASTVERVAGRSFIYFLIGDAVSAERIEDAKRQILSILTENHGKYDGRYEKYFVQEMALLLSMIDSTTETITALISIIAGIALVVAGIGIMNVMLVSVKERTKEIGTRKALGAKQSSILNQFLLETIMLCGGGGLLGVAGAVVAIHTVSSLTKWPALVSFPIIRLALLLSLITGLLFGLYPAGQAAKMDPVEALRYE
jgi:putative ABC transport system permease protein